MSTTLIVIFSIIGILLLVSFVLINYLWGLVSFQTQRMDNTDEAWMKSFADVYLRLARTDHVPKFRTGDSVAMVYKKKEDEDKTLTGVVTNIYYAKPYDSKPTYDCRVESGITVVAEENRLSLVEPKTKKK